MLTTEELKQYDEYMKNKQLAEQQAEQEAFMQAQIAAREALIAKVKAAGYVGDGCLEDFRKLLNNPEWFGPNWERQAKELAASQNSQQMFLDYFSRYYTV